MNQDLGASITQPGQGAVHGVGGAPGLGLQGVVNAVSKQSFNRGAIGGRHYDDDAFHPHPAQQVHGVAQHRFAADEVQHLGDAGLHPFPIPRGQYHSGPFIHGGTSEIDSVE